MYVKDLIEDVIDYLDNNITYDVFKKLNTSYVNKSDYVKLIICDICEHWLNYQNTQSQYNKELGLKYKHVPKHVYDAIVEIVHIHLEKSSD